MISNIDQRVLFYDDSAGTFTDLTKEVNQYKEGSVSLTFEAGDYLYFGSFLPFNHKFFKLGTVNIVASTPLIETFDGTEWDAVADQIDYTELTGSTFGKTGILQFNPDLNEHAWAFVDRTTTNSNLPEFSSGPDIYNKYWARISYDAVISYDLEYVGSKFCDDDDLYAEYPYFRSSTILNSWESGKTDWEEQEIICAEYIVFDLKRRNIIVERSQVIELSTLKESAIHRTAHLIWNGLGPGNYEAEINKSAKLYVNAMNQNKFEQDADGDGRKDRSEQVMSTRRASR